MLCNTPPNFSKEVETTKMNNIPDPQQQWTTRLFPNSKAMSQHLEDLCPLQQWMMVLFEASKAIMQQIANLYPQMQMQGHAPPWYPLQGNPSAGYTWEGYPLQCGGVLLPQALVVNYPRERYSNDVYPPPQHVYSPPEAYLTPVGYPNDVYTPPPQQFNGLNFFEGMSVQSHTHTQTGGGQNNPQIQGVSELNTQGNIIMGPNGGNTNEIFVINNIHLHGNRTIANSLDDLAASNIPGSEVLLLYRQV